MIHFKYIYILFIILIIILFHSKNIDLTIKETYEDTTSCNYCTRKRMIHNCDSCDSIENFNQVDLKTNQVNLKTKTNRVTFDLTPHTFYY